MNHALVQATGRNTVYSSFDKNPLSCPVVNGQSSLLNWQKCQLPGSDKEVTQPGKLRYSICKENHIAADDMKGFVFGEALTPEFTTYQVQELPDSH